MKNKKVGKAWILLTLVLGVSEIWASNFKDPGQQGSVTSTLVGENLTGIKKFFPKPKDVNIEQQRQLLSEALVKFNTAWNVREAIMIKTQPGVYDERILESKLFQRNIDVISTQLKIIAKLLQNDATFYNGSIRKQLEKEEDHEFITFELTIHYELVSILMSFPACKEDKKGKFDKTLRESLFFLGNTFQSRGWFSDLRF